jgi:hypothetical protein
MPQWETNGKLFALNRFCQKCLANPESATDLEFVQFVKASLWPCNASDAADAGFAIIAEALSVRPHLARELIALPVDALISGGMWEDDDWRKMVQIGIDCATNPESYVVPTEAGKIWLTQEWPKLEGMIEEVFREMVGEG